MNQFFLYKLISVEFNVIGLILIDHLVEDVIKLSVFLKIYLSILVHCIFLIHVEIFFNDLFYQFALKVVNVYIGPTHVFFANRTIPRHGVKIYVILKVETLIMSAKFAPYRYFYKFVNYYITRSE